MKKKDIFSLSNEELEKKLKDFENELNAERASKGKVNSGKIRSLKKMIARIKTIISQRSKGIVK
ncbi:MAG: 50S ribosomal protein L29 [Candidatus Micrarchaeia archaeon]